MLFMLINRTRSNLSAEDFAKLGEMAKSFYADIPDGVKLHSDWGATDGSRTFALIEAEEQSSIDALQAPFRPYVDVEIIPVRALAGWEAS